MEMNFESLRNLHGCANDLLESPNTRQALIHHRHEQWVDEICEGSLRLLDICGVTRDVLLLVKQHLQDLQSALRRRYVGDFGVERRITNSRIPIKKIMRKLVKCLEALRGMEVKDRDDPLALSEDVDQNVMVLVIVIREMRMNTIGVVELILSYLSISKPKMKPKRRFLFLNCLRGKRVANASSEGMGYESFGMKMEESASKRLQCLEAAVEGFLVESDCMFRRLIQTRVSLLNILNN